MDSEDRARDIILAFFKSMGRYSVRQASRPFRYAAKRMGTNIGANVKKYELKSVKKLIRRNPRAGIHIEADLTREVAERLKSELKKYHQEFVMEKDPEKEGKFQIVTLGGNDKLCSNIRNKYRLEKAEKANKINSTKNKSDRSSFNNALGAARAARAADEAKRAAEGLNVQKHKNLHRDINAR